jgi:hypothetical protein
MMYRYLFIEDGLPPPMTVARQLNLTCSITRARAPEKQPNRGIESIMLMHTPSLLMERGVPDTVAALMQLVY